MNPALLAQLEQLIEWGVTGLLDWKAMQANNDQFAPALKAALAANEPLDDATWASIDAAAQAAHDRLANA